MQFFPNGTRIRAKSPAPKTIADQQRIRTAEMPFFGTEIASERWRDSPDLQKARSYECLRYFLWKNSGIFRIVFCVVARDGLKRVVEPIPVLKSHRRQASLPTLRFQIVLFQDHQLVAIGKGQRSEENGVDSGKHRAVRANTQSQGQHHRNGERRRLANKSKCRPEVGGCRFQYRQSMYIPQFLFDLLAPAKFQQRFSPRVVWCHPGGNVLVNEFLDMKANF